jgi:PAS domain S-box-containing protein
MQHDEPSLDKSLLEEDAHDLYENAPCGYILTLPGGTIVKVNATFLKWTGYSRDALVGKKRFQDLLPIAGKIFHDTHYGPLLQMQGFVNELAFEIICEAGQRLPVLLNSIVKKDDAGNPLLIRTTLLDARGRRAYEQELLLARRRAEEAEASLRQFTENLEYEVAIRTAERDRLWRVSQDILAIGSIDGYFSRINPAFTAVLGWTEEEIRVMPFSELVHPDEHQELKENMRRLKAGESISQAIGLHLHKDGSYRWLTWNIVPEGEHLYFVGRDVTEKKKQAEVLRQAEDALRQAQKMEAVGQLTGGLAHDFNNLLAGMVGNLQLMRVRLSQGLTDGLIRYVDAAEAVAQRATALTHRMLAFARRQTLAPEVLNVNELVASMADMFRQTIGPNIQINTVLAGDIWKTLSDRNQLESALLNLVINARDAMPEGGRIVIETRNTLPENSGENLRSAESSQRYVTISVTDTGTGMAPDVAAHAFDPFFTTKPIGQGTGLGLSMIFGFVKQSGGYVRIHSTLGEGTTVKLHLPRHVGEPQAKTSPQQPDVALSTERRCVILLVEDDPALRALLTEVLSENGYTIVQAEHGAEALRAVQSSQHLDLLITDIGLPGGMNGWELASAVRELRPSLKTILITAYVQDAKVRDKLMTLNMKVIIKPFALDAFIEKVIETIGEA